MKIFHLTKILLATSLSVLGYQTISLADTGQVGANGAENTNNTKVTNSGGNVKIDNDIKNVQNNDNSVKRNNSDDINNTSGSGSSIEDNSRNKSTNTTYYQPSSQSATSNQFTYSVTTENGENVVFGCPQKTSNFNIGGPYFGLGVGGSSSKIPADCVPLIEKSQLRLTINDARNAACGLGPGYLYELNRTLFAKTVAEIKGTTYLDELRLMSTAEVNQAKVSSLDTYNSVCKTNHTAVDSLPPVVDVPEPPEYNPPAVDVKN
jgi:hypothetical protein